MTPKPTITEIRERLNKVIQDPDIFVACAPNDMRVVLAALKKYGGPLNDCRKLNWDDPCTCGWDALNKTPEKKDEN